MARHSASGGETAGIMREPVAVLDGGMGHQLKALGIDISGPVGSMRRFLGVAVANLENPELVKKAHLAFIDAGAEIIITNNYACVPKCLQYSADVGLDLKRDGIASIIEAAGKIARSSCQARPERRITVAGSLPPLAESYRPDMVGPFADNLEQYKLIATAIAPFSDVLICETMSTAEEARAAVTAAAGTGLPIWVSWTLDEHKPVLRSGESLQDAYAAVSQVAGAKLQACLFNCTSPEIITCALPILHGLAPGMRIGAYANGFCTAASGDGEYRDLSPKDYYDEFASKWISSGATIVGGCCGIFPQHIAYLKQGVMRSKL